MVCTDCPHIKLFMWGVLVVVLCRDLARLGNGNFLLGSALGVAVELDLSQDFQAVDDLSEGH
jgi:hypothetical protein